MTNPNLTAIGFVLDKSGSMYTIAEDTIGGFNSFLQSQKDSEGEAKISLGQFDNNYELVYDYVDVKEVPDLSRETYIPGGGTALLDAIGTMINGLGFKFEHMEEKDRPSSVIIVIMTDGYENASRQYNQEKIFDMISHQKEKYNWEFMFLGASQDSITIGSSYGVDASKSVYYNTGNMAGTLGMVSEKISTYRSSVARGLSKEEASTSLDYSQDDRDEVV